MRRLLSTPAAAVLVLLAARAPALGAFAVEAASPGVSPSAGPVSALPNLPVADARWCGAMASFASWLGTPQGASAAALNPALQRLRALTPDEIADGRVLGPLTARLEPALLAAARNPAALRPAERIKLIKAIAVAEHKALPDVEAAVSLWVAQANSGHFSAEEIQQFAALSKAFQLYSADLGAAHRTLADAALARARLLGDSLLFDPRDGVLDNAIVRSGGRTTALRHLPRAQRRQVVRAELAAQQSPGAVREAVVLGGGPSGLMSAFNLLTHGAHVTIIEQRDGYNRPIHFNVRQSLLDQLAHFDPVLVPRVLDKLGVINRAEFIDATLGQKIERTVPTISKPDGRMRIAAARTMMESPSVGQIKVSDLETILSQRLHEIAEEDIARGRRPRVAILSNAQPDLAPAAGDRYSVAAQPTEARARPDGRTERVPVGRAVDLGTPDLIVVAEGAGSVSRDLLGVTRQATSPETRFIAGYLDRDSGGLIRRRYAETEADADGAVHGVRQIAVGHSKNAKTWSLVEVPANVKLETREEIRAYYVREVAKVLEISAAEAATVTIEWGPNPFRLQQWIADTAVPAANVVLVGDAVGNAHFLTSGGVMTAAVPHQQELDRYLSGRTSAGLTDAQQREIYDKRVRAATLEWARLGIREFGRQVVAANFGSQFTELLAKLRREKGLVETPPDLRPTSLGTSASERALEGSPQGEVAWNRAAAGGAAAPAVAP